MWKSTTFCGCPYDRYYVDPEFATIQLASNHSVVGKVNGSARDLLVFFHNGSLRHNTARLICATAIRRKRRPHHQMAILVTFRRSVCHNSVLCDQTASSETTPAWVRKHRQYMQLIEAQLVHKESDQGIEKIPNSQCLVLSWGKRLLRTCMIIHLRLTTFAPSLSNCPRCQLACTKPLPSGA